MKQSKILFLAAALAAAGVAIAAPQAGSATGIGPRAKVDANGDGVITRAEAAAHPRLARHFDRLDANRDGRLDRGERPQHGRRGHVIGHILRLDANGDGRIARTEAGDSKLGARFAQIDTNGDGYIVRGEMEAARARMHAQRMQQRQQKAREAFAAADRNRDGRLSRDEATQAMPRVAKAFAWLDADRDGFLGPQELRPARGGR